MHNQIPVLEQPIKPVTFANSRSAMQLVQKEFDNPVKELSHRIDQFVDNRLNEENWLGTLVIPLVMYKALYASQIAKIRVIDGKQKPDMTRILSKELFLAEKAWAFFSARGAAYPKGKNVIQRVANTFLNPQASSLQLEYLLLLPSRLLQFQSHLNAGLSKGKNAANNEPHNIRLIQAGLTAMWVGLLGLGHFKKRPASTDEKAQDDAMPVYFKNSESLGLISTPEPKQEGLNVKHVLKNAWKYDKPLLAGLITEIVLSSFLSVEAWHKSDKTKQDLFEQGRNAFSTVLLTTAYSVYTLQRISRSNFKPPEESTQVGKLSKPLNAWNSVLVTSR